MGHETQFHIHWKRASKQWANAFDHEDAINSLDFWEGSRLEKQAGRSGRVEDSDGW